MGINIQRQFKKNLKSFKNYFPHIYKAFVSRNLDRTVNIKKRNNKILLHFGNKSLTIDEIKHIIHNQIENLEKNTICFTTKENYDPNSGFGIQKNYIGKLFEITSTFRKKKKKNDYIPIMIIYGVISGIHIQKIIEKYEIDHLIIVEKDVSLMKPSLYIINWEEIFASFSKEDKSINILISDNPLSLANKAILTIINDISPSFVTKILLYLHELCYKESLAFMFFWIKSCSFFYSLIEF